MPSRYLLLKITISGLLVPSPYSHTSRKDAHATTTAKPLPCYPALAALRLTIDSSVSCAVARIFSMLDAVSFIYVIYSPSFFRVSLAISTSCALCSLIFSALPSAVFVSPLSSTASFSLLSQSVSDFSAASVICSFVSRKCFMSCLNPSVSVLSFADA